MEYKVIPFVAVIDPLKGTSDQVAEQLEAKIKQGEASGWTYTGLENVSTYVNPESGCFGFGSKPGYTITHQVLLFKKE
ncbi:MULTISPECIES: hypothetical protein [Olivibacter]|uniref:DUF4177 domain-containing protein n=1 Tax=Olivibacter jilunii TaxID=985016 RepID=A0ABW6B215_9SPHI